MANPYYADPLGEALRRNAARWNELEARVKQLEKLVHYPNAAALRAEELKSQAAQVEATKDLYAPLRSNVDPLIRLSNFARRLLDPHDLGHAVTFEVRELAREALGKEKQG